MACFDGQRLSSGRRHVLRISPAPPPPPPKQQLCRRSECPTGRGRRSRSVVLRRAKTEGPFQQSSGYDGGEEISRSTLIWRAAKLPIYSVVAVPLAVGSSAAYLKTGVFFAKRFFNLLIASSLIVAWLNLSNDVYDFDTGADVDKPESVVNLTGKRGMTLFGARLSLVFGWIGFVWAAEEARDIRIIIAASTTIFCGYIYQGPPFRLGYRGLGEPLCFVAFGPAITAALYLAQGNPQSYLSGLALDGTLIALSVLVGLTSTIILFCSHFHQVEGDFAVGKMSPLVRMGTKTGSLVVKCGVITLYFLPFIFFYYNTLPWTCTLLCSFTFPMAKLVIDFVERNHEDKKKIFMAKYFCVRLHCLFGIALCTGLLIYKKLNY